MYNKQQLLLHNNQHTIECKLLEQLRQLQICKQEYKQTKRGRRGGRKRLSSNTTPPPSPLPTSALPPSSLSALPPPPSTSLPSSPPPPSLSAVTATPPTERNYLPSPQASNERMKNGILRTLVINFQSIWNKKEELTNLVEMTKSDIIIGTETWLNGEMKTNELNLSDSFEIFRNDRKHQCKRGEGGIIICIRKTLTSDMLKFPNTTVSGEEIPVLFCRIVMKNKPPLMIGAVYRRPDRDIEMTKSICHTIKHISQKYSKSIIWIGGDFNLPDINWPDSSIDGNHYPKDLNTLYVEAITDSGLQQVVKENTRNNSLLDLFFTNHPSHVEQVAILPGLGDHDIVQVDNRVKPKRKRPVKRRIFIWKQANIPKLKQDANQFATRFLELYSTETDICRQWENFTSSMKRIMNDNVPQKTTTSKIHQPWINTTTKRLLRKKNKLYLEAKRTNSELAKEKFKKIKAETQRECRKAHRNHVNEIVNDNTNNNKKLWSYIKGINRDNAGITSLKDNNGTFQSDPKTKANILNNQFTSVFSDPSQLGGHEIHDEGQMDIPQMEEITITEMGVTELVNNIKEDKATGPDDIPAKLIKACSNEISPVLTLIFQSSLNQRKVPDDWKQAIISPIFKKGEKSKAENYRPVSITSITSKLLEHIIYSNIMSHLDAHTILTEAQHGFRRERSCETQLITTCNDLAENMNKQLQTDAILLDFSKAFDKVHHNILEHKLWRYGIRDNVLNWVMDFLTNRKQMVVVEGATSESTSVLSGVPQGTVLGPLLFLIYINDMSERISPGTQLRLFADDSLLYRTIQSKKDTEMLQYDLEKLQSWEKENSMEFHPQKCKVLKVTNKKKIIPSRYTLHNTTLEEVTKAKYLGVTINNKLTWKDHITNTCKKANSTLGFLRRNLHDSKKEIKMKCYKTFVRPTLEYSSTVWDPHHKIEINEIEKIQQRAIKFIHQNNNETLDNDNKSDLEPLQERRKNNKLTIFFKGLKDQTKLPLGGIKPNKRKPSKFMIPHSRVDTHLYSFLPSTLRQWNSLPDPIKNADTIDNFKENCKKLRNLQL